MAKGGRPPKVNIEDLINDVDNYLATADPPIVKEYAIEHNITGNYLYHLADKLEREGDDRLKHTIKKIADAKEVMLERKGLSGAYQSPMAIFSLKQLGWKDKPEEHNEDDDMVKKFLEEMKGHD